MRLGSDVWVMLALIIMIVIIFSASERIGVNEGLGWDGRDYARWAADFPRFRTGLTPYGAHRILPSAVVYSMLRLAELPTTRENVIRGFVFLDMLAVVVSLLAWRCAAIGVGADPPTRAVGLTALVVNFAALKWMPYNPVLTDATAFMLGSLALASWVFGRQWALVVVSLLAAFTWPALLLPCSLLLLFPRRRSPERLAGDGSRMGTLLATASALLVFGFMTVVATAGGRAFESRVVANWVTVRLGLVNSLTVTTVVSLVTVAIAVFFATRPLWAALAVAGTWEGFRRVVLWRMALVATIHMTVWLAVSQMTTLQARGPRDYVATAVLTGLRWPLVALVAHAAFYGPVILLAVLEWKGLCGALGREGPAGVLCMLVALLQALDSESRHVLPLFPLLVCYASKAVESFEWTRRRVIMFAVLAVLCSKVWLPIGPLPESPSGGVVSWATERYTMSIGPRMSWRMYLVQGGVAGLLIAAFRRVIVRLRAASVEV